MSTKKYSLLNVLLGILLLVLLPNSVIAISDIQLYDETNFPKFSIEANNEDFPVADHAEVKERMKTAFKDMLKIFRVACTQFTAIDNHDDVYSGYIEDDLEEGAKTARCKSHLYHGNQSHRYAKL